MAVKVRLRGWTQAGQQLTTMADRLEQRTENALMKSAEVYRDMVLQLIEIGDPSWVPKSEGEARRTGPKLFIGRTGQFRDNLKNRGIRRMRAGAGQKRVFVGARFDVQHNPSGMAMSKLAEILQNIPSEGDRDLFGPAWERAKPEVERRMKEIGRDLV